MRRVLSIALGFGIATVACLPAMAAATVQVVQGKVSVNQGQGYKQVGAASAVSTGDQVMAAPGSRAKILYSDGCAVDVYPGAVVTVPEKCYQPMTAGLEAAPWWLHHTQGYHGCLFWGQLRLLVLAPAPSQVALTTMTPAGVVIMANLMAELMTVVTTTIDNLSRPDKR